jgi:hypothetical protein
MRKLLIVAPLLGVVAAQAFAAGRAPERESYAGYALQSTLARMPSATLDSGPDGGLPNGSRAVFYCQPPAAGYSVNASTAYDSELADDIPDSLAGRSIGEVTLYVTEWSALDWIDPQGLVIRFYDGACPPPLEPAVACSVGWTQLATELLDFNPPTRIVYAATAALPSPVAVTAGMSLGAYVVNDWGQVPPYAGLTLSPPDSVAGCGEAYWDDETHGSPRWSPVSAATDVAADLAFCLAEEGTGVAEAAPSSWGRLKSLFR